MNQSVAIDLTELEVTPFFKVIDVENVPQSEIRGEEVRMQIEAVEIHLAGNSTYRGVFPVDAVWKKEGHNEITYMERFGDQYLAWKEGGPQVASGTPLTVLSRYGVTPAQISMCKVHKIYSVEALHGLQGAGIKSLGFHANKLKEAADAYMADRSSGAEVVNRTKALEDEIAELRALLEIKSNDEPTPDDEYAGLTDADIKALIKDKTGFAPKGNPSRASLVEQLKEIEA